MRYKCLDCGNTQTEKEYKENCKIIEEILKMPYDQVPKLEKPRCPKCKSENITRGGAVR